MKTSTKQTPIFVTHVYDIDFFEILDKLKDRYTTNCKLIANYQASLASLKELEENYVKSKKLEGKYLKIEKRFRHYVMPSSDILYPTMLAFKLIVSDPHKIQAILSYQSVLFSGNYYADKDNFIGLVEFNIYKLVKSADFLNESIRLDKIANWLENNRKFIIINAYTEKRVTIQAEFADILAKKIEPYFDESQYPDLYNVINKDISVNEKLIFNGSLIELTDLFKRLKANKKIVVKSNEALAQWISDKFGIKKNIIDGKLKGINKKVVLDYLVRESRIPKGKARIICEDIAPLVNKK